VTPYFDDGTCQLFLGDSREVLPALGVTADCVIADPPYGQETSLAWDVWPDGWLEVAAATSRALWCFGSWRVFGPRWHEFTDAGWKFAQDVVWEKHNGSGFAADRFKRVHETVTHWYQGPWGDLHQDVPRVSSVNPFDRRTRTRKADLTPHAGRIGARTETRDGTRLQRSVIKAPQVRGGHPTQKPTKILAPLIEYGCPKGGLVVDPFAGSGSTLVAARESGRRSVGVEVSEAYCEAAALRLSQAPLPLAGA
jgi:site-specific DNA-methyltransferase (adenine-specific)